VIAQCKFYVVVVVVVQWRATFKLHPLERSETQNLEAVLERLAGGPEEQHARLCHVLLPTHHPQDPVRRRDGVAQILRSTSTQPGKVRLSWFHQESKGVLKKEKEEEVP